MPIPRRFVYATVDSSFLLNGCLDRNEKKMDSRRFLDICSRLRTLSEKSIRIPNNVFWEIILLTKEFRKDSQVVQALEELHTLNHETRRLEYRNTGGYVSLSIDDADRSFYNALTDKVREIGAEINPRYNMKANLSTVDVDFCASALSYLMGAPVIAATRDKLAMDTMSYLYGIVNSIYMQYGLPDNQLYLVENIDEFERLYKQVLKSEKSNVRLAGLGKNGIGSNNSPKLIKRIWMDRDPHS